MISGFSQLQSLAFLLSWGDRTGSVMEWSIKKKITVQSFPLFALAILRIFTFWGCTRCSQNSTEIYARVRITGNCSLVNVFCMYNLRNCAINGITFIKRIILFMPTVQNTPEGLFLCLFISTCNLTHTQLEVDFKRAPDIPLKIYSYC